MRKKYAPEHVMNRDGVYYYVRHIPYDLIAYYNVSRLCFSLKTKSVKAAIRASKSVSQRLEDYWLGLRLQNMDIPAIQVVRNNDNHQDNTIHLSEACELYLRLKGVGKDRVFIRTANRNTQYVTKLLGDRPISSYSSNEAAQFRDWCIEQGMSIKTVKRVFSSIRAIINLAIAEEGLDCSNAFSRTFMPEEDRQRRLPIPIECIRAIQSDYHHMDDDMRWLVALLSDTGMRLGEAVGLSVDDIRLDDETPHVNITPHPWRRLKTKGSERCVPLVGQALWAASRAIKGSSGSSFLFPRYNRASFSNANSASAAINKWLKSRMPEGCVIHSFRHSMRDRLRAVECPSDIIDAIGGWTTTGVGQRYGLGQPLDVKAKWMNKLIPL